MLELLMGGIYDTRHLGGFMWSDMLTNFHEYLYRCSSSITVLSQQFEWL
jgi:hypothetical protein